MSTHSPLRSASTAGSRASEASTLLRETGICCAPLSTHFTGALRNSSALARNRGGRPWSHRNSPTANGSISLTWLAATITPPSAGRFSTPCHARVVNRRSRGLAATTTNRYQKPTRRRALTAGPSRPPGVVLLTCEDARHERVRGALAHRRPDQAPRRGQDAAGRRCRGE